jgi:hypothetical protein
MRAHAPRHCHRQAAAAIPSGGLAQRCRQVLHFNPVRYSRFSQALDLTSGELIPGQPLLLKCRKEITREQAIQLWRQKRKQGWQLCEPQWTPPPALKPPVHRPAASMGATGLPPCC